MKVAAFQMSATSDPDKRLDRISEAMRTAADAGTDLLVAPELALSGYGRGEEMHAIAQPANGIWMSVLKEMVADTGVSLVAGFPERVEDDCYISAAIINRDETSAPLIYRKGQLYGDYEKSIFRTRGPSTVLTQMQGMTLGFLICYDIEFPENTRRLALAGADSIIVPTALPESPSAAFIARHVVRARAFENHTFVVYADNSDADALFRYQGLSSIVAPDGSVLAEAPAYGDALLQAELRHEDFLEARQENPYLRDVQEII